MKVLRFLLLLLIVILIPACYSAREYPLQPREKIIFQDTTRANEFRTLSGNDAQHGGNVVEITRPTRVTCE
jgi:hypothetical protein